MFNIECISIVDEDQRVKKVVEDYQRLMAQDMEERMRLKRRAENLDIYKIERSFDTTEAAARNIGGGDGGGGGSILGAVVGLGMAQPLGNAIGNMMGTITPNVQPQPSMSKDEVIKLLKELGELKTAGILTEEEFAKKKEDLLNKI